MKNTISKFIKKIGKEGEVFLDLIQGLPKEKFAVIKISGSTIEKELDSIAEDIALMHQLDIYPMIVHGAGSSLDAKLPRSQKIDGVRVTNKEDMPVVKQGFIEIGSMLAEQIIAKGGSAKYLEGVFDCEKLAKYGYVGDVKKVDLAPILDAIEQGCIPVISPLGICCEEHVNVNADTAAKALVKAISPKKLVMLTDTGGVLDENGEVIPFINVGSAQEYCHVTGGMYHKVREIADFLQTQPSCEVVITSAAKLIQELFTVKGAGTFIKYHLIHATQNIGEVDKDKLELLIEGAFGKKLVPKYFDNGIKNVFYEQDYKGVAIMKQVQGFPYMDKFAVAKHARGTGLGKSLWNQLMKEYDCLVWRASPENDCNPFYLKQCEGMIKKNGWFVYWKNLEQEKIFDVIEEVANKEKTVI